MLLSNNTLREIAERLAPRFSAFVIATGTLTDEQMLSAMEDARQAGEPVPRVKSDRSLRLINEYHMGERL